KVKDIRETEPAEDSGFLEDGAKLGANDRWPFQRVWYSEKWAKDRHSYEKVILPDISIAYLQDTAWKDRKPGDSQDELAEDAQKLADFWEELRSNRSRNEVTAKMDLTTTSGPKTLIIEAAIVELVPNNAILKIAGTAAGQAVTGGGLIKKLGNGSIAFEMQVRDSETGEVLIQAADREVFQSALVDVASYTWYHGAKNVIKEWQEQMYELYSSPFDQKVEDGRPIKLIAL
ncbi:MAG: DUF3313 family protein, partial [Verrucomicrobiota bacterium]